MALLKYGGFRLGLFLARRAPLSLSYRVAALLYQATVPPNMA